MFIITTYQRLDLCQPLLHIGFPLLFCETAWTVHLAVFNLCLSSPMVHLAFILLNLFPLSRHRWRTLVDPKS